MRDKNHNADKDAAEKKADRKIGTSPAGKGKRALVDGCHNADEGKRGQDLQKPDQHVAEYAGFSVRREAAHVARELAAMSRQKRAGVNIQGQEVLLALARLIDAPASSAADALAFAVTAQMLLPLVGTDDGLSGGCVTSLLDRTVQTLELIAGQKSDQFNGSGIALN